MTTVTNANRTVPREQLRTKIYGAAIAAFRAHGYERATIDVIAQRAGVAKGTFFNFYKTKADVLGEYYWRIDARIAPLRKSLDPRAPVKALARYAAAVEREFDREGDLLVALLLQTQRDDALRDMDYESGDADAKQFADFFRRARALGTVRKSLDPDRAAALIIDIWAGAVRVWLSRAGKISLTLLFKSKVDDVFVGFAPPASAR